MSIFKRTGFDSIISKGTSLNGSLNIDSGSTLLLDGAMFGKQITVTGDIEGKDAGKTTLVVGGTAAGLELVNVQNVVIIGELKCSVLHVEGTLAVKNGGVLEATEIRYRSLVVEPKAFVIGSMKHLDRGSNGKE